MLDNVNRGLDPLKTHSGLCSLKISHKLSWPFRVVEFKPHIFHRCFSWQKWSLPVLYIQLLQTTVKDWYSRKTVMITASPPPPSCHEVCSHSPNFMFEEKKNHWLINWLMHVSLSVFLSVDTWSLFFREFERFRLFSFATFIWYWAPYHVWLSFISFVSKGM